MRLKEHHCISPQTPVPAGGSEDDALDDGIRNAWFLPVDLVTRRVRRLISQPDVIRTYLALTGLRHPHLLPHGRDTQDGARNIRRRPT